MDERKQEFLVRDLAGCDIETESGEILGKLVDVYPTGANDVFVVRGASTEYLIPALKSVVVRISLDERRIVVKLPDGLREIYE